MTELERTARAPSARSLRGPVVAGTVLGALTSALLTVRDIPDVDLWLHLRIGEHLSRGGRFAADTDPLAALADRPYLPTQWLAQVTMAGVHDVAGMTGIQLFRLLLVLALGAAVYAACRVTASPAPAALASAATMLGSAAGWGERPQLVGLVLLATTVALWWRASVHGGVPWLVVPVAWVWANVHGSWPLGVAAGALVLAGGLADRSWEPARARRGAVVLIAAVLAAAAGPLGVANLLAPLQVGEVARLTANEWQAPALSNPLLVVVLLSAAAAGLSVARSRGLRWTRALAVLAAAVLALWMVRTIAVGAIVLAPALAHALHLLRSRGPAPVPPVGPVDRPVWSSALAVLLVVGGWHAVTTPFDPPVQPTVSAALASLPDTAVLAVDGTAVGWVQYAHPDRRPLRDLRAEVYSVAVATAYESFQEAGPGWAQYAEEHGVTAVLADRDLPLDRALATDPAWAVRAADEGYRLWVHR